MDPDKLYELMKNRRSVRKYTDKEVDSKIIDRIIDAARWAPSAGNQQPLEIIVLTEQSDKDKLLEATGRQSFILGAPYVLIICSNSTDCVNRYQKRGLKLYNIQDTAAAVQNILLLVTAYGLSSCWIGAFNEQSIIDDFNLPENVRPVAMLPIGYAPEEISRNVPPRKELDSIVFKESYGKPYYT